MRIKVIGTGHAGLVTGAIFSNQGHDVCCIDGDAARIDLLNVGDVPVLEPGLQDMVRSAVEQGSLTFSADIKDAVQESEIVFLTLDGSNSESRNLEVLLSTARSIACSIEDETIIVIVGDHVPVGTSQRVAKMIENCRGNAVRVAIMCEGMERGTALNDCLNPERIVLGVNDKLACEALRRLFHPLIATSVGPCPVIVMNPTDVEMLGRNQLPAAA